MCIRAQLGPFFSALKTLPAPQRRIRIDPHRPQRGHVARRQRHGREKDFQLFPRAGVEPHRHVVRIGDAHNAGLVLSCAPIATGTQASNARPAMLSRNSCGATPMMVSGGRFTRAVLPMAPGSALKRRFHML